MNKNILGTLAFSLMAMVLGMGVIFIVQTAIVHAGLIVAACFGVVGVAGFMAIAACTYLIHQEGNK